MTNIEPHEFGEGWRTKDGVTQRLRVRKLFTYEDFLPITTFKDFLDSLTSAVPEEDTVGIVFDRGGYEEEPTVTVQYWQNATGPEINRERLSRSATPEERYAAIDRAMRASNSLGP